MYYEHKRKRTINQIFFRKVDKEMNSQTKKGFTIIEVVLVLAIAGLIFLMVFIALPALQRSQRDTQRRTDVQRVQAAVQSYQTNNRNNLPSNSDFTGGSFKKNYLETGGDTFQDPNGNEYSFKAGPAKDNFDAGNTTIYFQRNSTCNGEIYRSGQGAKKIAFQYKLEGGGKVCISN